VDCSVIPTENSTNGPVNLTLELLAAHSKDGVNPQLNVVGETSVRVRQCLAGRRKGWRPGEAQGATEDGSKSAAPGFSHITSLHTHPQAWTQCTPFLDKHFAPEVTRHDEDSTSAAAELVSQDTTGTSAAICSSLAAKLFGLDVLAGGIEGEDGNETRFLVLQQGPVGSEQSHENSLIVAKMNLNSTKDELERRLAEVGFKKSQLYWSRSEGTWIYLFLYGMDQGEQCKIEQLRGSLAPLVSSWKNWGRWYGTK
jgi:prephenate dehydratase